MPPAVLLISAVLPELDQKLSALYTVHRLYQQADKDAYLREHRQSIVAVVTGGALGIATAMMEQLPALKIVTINGIGTDAVDLAYAKGRGIHVTTTPDVLTADVADLAIGLAISALRGLSAGDRYVRAGAWGKAPLGLANKFSGKKVGIVGLGRVGRAIDYADRATLSIAGTAVSRDLGLSPTQLGIVFSAFAWAYVIGQIPGGWLLDRYGAKRVYGASIVLWSLCTLAQGFVNFSASAVMAAGALFALRFMLGLVESPAFPGNARVVSTWFPTAERGLATAMFNSAQYLAVVLFTPLMAWLTHVFGWQHVFVFMGGLGLVLAAFWYAIMGEPKSHPRMSAAELRFIEAGGALTNLDDTIKVAKPKLSGAEIRQLFTSRMMWGVYIGQYCITALTYFFITWFPIYLIKGRGMTVMTVGLVAVLPAICGFGGGIIGGALSDWLIRRGMSASTARKIPFMVGMGLSTCVVAANFVDTNSAVIAIMALAFFGKGLGAVGWAVVSDTAPREMTGLCGGVFNGLGNVAGIVTPIVIGYVVATTGSFHYALWFVGAHGLLAILAYGVLAGPFKRLVIKR